MTDRIWLIAVLFALLMGVFLIRLIDLQLVQGSHLAQVVDQSRHVTEVVPPRRGRILDRTGAALVDNRAVYHLGVVLADLELSGRERRLVPLWRLDEQHTDALVAELAVRAIGTRLQPGARCAHGLHAFLESCGRRSARGPRRLATRSRLASRCGCRSR